MSQTTTESTTSKARLLISWAIVVIPLMYGLYETLLDAAGLFTG